MKVGKPFIGSEVPLPPEILDLVLFHVGQERTRSSRQYDLWSCCIVSRAWYSATIERLYRWPHLTSRNFDKFARTLCPPLSSHVRTTGLEKFVVDLDMDRLAYESTKSLTARLLRRTRLSLECFIAPSVSFSLTGLAPLSKAERLKHLDLSHDFYDIDMSQLCRAVCQLTQLSFMSLPKAALKRAYVAQDTHYPWPPNLVHLQLNGIAPDTVERWNRLIADLPKTLHALALSFLAKTSHHVLQMLEHVESSAEQIISLHATSVLDYTGVGLSKLFPSLKSFSLPYDSIDVEGPFFEEAAMMLPPTLETLILVHDPNSMEAIFNINTNMPSPEDLVGLALVFPMLKRMEVPEAYVSHFRKAPLTFVIDGIQPPVLQKADSEPPFEVKSKLGIFASSQVGGQAPWSQTTRDVGSVSAATRVLIWVLSNR